jgi:hypothetical protein
MTLLTGEYLNVKELAFVLKKHPSYIYAMRARGFPMPGGVATVRDARAWLAQNPAPKSRGVKRG